MKLVGCPIIKPNLLLLVLSSVPSLPSFIARDSIIKLLYKNVGWKGEGGEWGKEEVVT